MDWKATAIEKLKDYEAKKLCIDQLALEIKRLELKAEGLHSSIREGAGSAHSTDAYDDMLVNNITQRQELMFLHTDALRWVEFVERGLSVLTGEERLILDRFYIHRSKGNVDRLCEELCVERSRVYKLKDQALRHFTLALYGVTET